MAPLRRGGGSRIPPLGQTGPPMVNPDLVAFRVRGVLQNGVESKREVIDSAEAIEYLFRELSRETGWPGR